LQIVLTAPAYTVGIIFAISENIKSTVNPTFEKNKIAF